MWARFNDLFLTNSLERKEYWRYGREIRQMPPNFNHVIKDNITRPESCWYHVPTVCCTEKGTYLCGILLPNLWALSNIRSHQRNQYWGTFYKIPKLKIPEVSLQKCWDSKKKERLRNFSRLENIDKLLCGILYWVLEQKRIFDNWIKSVV